MVDLDGSGPAPDPTTPGVCPGPHTDDNGAGRAGPDRGTRRRPLLTGVEGRGSGQRSHTGLLGLRSPSVTDFS